MTAQPLYTMDILRLAGSLAEPKALDREDGRAEARSPTCGSRIETAVQVEHGRVVALSQEVHACAFGQASAALVERQAAGRSSMEIQAALDEVSDWLAGGAEPGWGLAALAPALNRRGRHGAILLPFRALIAAIETAK
jgi:NifU-like protein involved in Fe-S cluster formation